MHAYKYPRTAHRTLAATTSPPHSTAATGHMPTPATATTATTATTAATRTSPRDHPHVLRLAMPTAATAAHRVARNTPKASPSPTCRRRARRTWTSCRKKTAAAHAQRAQGMPISTPATRVWLMMRRTRAQRLMHNTTRLVKVASTHKAFQEPVVRKFGRTFADDVSGIKT
jgi:hypothetical protein